MIIAILILTTIGSLILIVSGIELMKRPLDSEPMHFVCSHCPDRDKQEAELVGKKLTHGICSECFKREMDAVRKFNTANPIFK